MELHPLAGEFASVAQAYERGMREHAPAVIGAIAAGLGIGPGDRVLDLGGGTGKLSRALVAYRVGVLAVEPQAGHLVERRPSRGSRRRSGRLDGVYLELFAYNRSGVRLTVRRCG